MFSLLAARRNWVRKFSIERVNRVLRAMCIAKLLEDVKLLGKDDKPSRESSGWYRLLEPGTEDTWGTERPALLESDID